MYFEIYAFSNESPYFISIRFSKYSSDYGFPSKVIDNILTPDGTNHFQETFVLTNFGNIYKTSSFTKSWNIQKSPLDSNGAKIFVNDFYVSTDKIQTE